MSSCSLTIGCPCEVISFNAWLNSKDGEGGDLEFSRPLHPWISSPTHHPQDSKRCRLPNPSEPWFRSIQAIWLPFALDPIDPRTSILTTDHLPNHLDPSHLTIHPTQLRAQSSLPHLLILLLSKISKTMILSPSILLLNKPVHPPRISKPLAPPSFSFTRSITPSAPNHTLALLEPVHPPLSLQLLGLA